MMVNKEVKQLIEQALADLSLKVEGFSVERPGESKNGDYASNVALVAFRQMAEKMNGQTNTIKVARGGMEFFDNPQQLADKIIEKIKGVKHPAILNMESAGAGFINFYLNPEFLLEQVKKVLELGDKYGVGTDVAGYKVMVEYTDPNPFKIFHIGHLLPNVIGESLSNIAEANGAEVKRACYQGDVGLHVAKAIYGLKNGQSLFEAYAYGHKMSEESEPAKLEIIELNKKIYSREDAEVNKLYDAGKQESLDYFEQMYKKLGTKFDYYFFESEAGPFGKRVVEEHQDIFKVGERGAVVYEGEQDGLHTRVFINSEGLPTYEAKELGLAKIKYDKYPYDYSIVVSANEISEYFKVLLAVMRKILPDLANKTRHVSHGMLRLPSGKMSSRTGNVIAAEDLLNEVKSKIKEKIKDNNLTDEVLTQIAVGAVKYSILKQDSSKDIIFDFDKSLSFEGSSGPYLQYTFARTQSVLDKAKNEKIEIKLDKPEEVGEIEKLLVRYPEVVYRSGEELAPHHLVTYLTELASSFNAYYANNKIVSEEENSAYRVALTAAVGQVLKNGLNLLGIVALDRM
ncbi:MAG: arginine--tRNA ligase [Candidatus Pacebacteria bacterium]|nr:arginine--tRNA ligase [Candidatus Paceibacterota bacterium]